MKLTNLTARLAFFFLLPLIAGPVIHLSAQSSVTEQYILKYKDIAESEMVRTGVPAAISLAQGILESQSGQGWLVTHSHNHFGVKCKNGWTGPSIDHDDDRRNECFRVYASDDSSWRDHSDFLRTTPRYAFLFYLDPADYKAWAVGLRKAGYATDKHYADRLIKTIETYHLERYSQQVLAMGKGRPESDFQAMLDRKVARDRAAAGIPEVQETPQTRAAPAEDKASAYPAGEFHINGRRVVYLPGGTQLIAVAEQHHIRLSRLVSNNELQGDVLPQAMLIYLQKKRKTGVTATHRVAAGETLRNIAQREGIQLKWLCRFNHLGKDDAPAAGTLLYLTDYAPEEPSPEAGEKKRGFLARLFSGHKSSRALPSSRKEVGQTPASVASSSETAPEPAAEQPGNPRPPAVSRKEASSLTYEVKQGDTLYGIAREYKVPLDSLRKWNGIEGDTIQAGQKLIIKTGN